MKYLLIIVLLCTFSQARAVESESYYTGNELLEKCEACINETSVAKGNACAGYILGISDLHEMFVALGMLKKGWCKPLVSVETNQLVRIVTKFLQEHPEDLHFAASELVADALTKAFPCE